MFYKASGSGLEGREVVREPEAAPPCPRASFMVGGALALAVATLVAAGAKRNGD